MINPTLVYLAGPIDEVDEGTAKGWREDLAEIFGEGVLLFSPAHAYFGVGPATASKLDLTNRHVISQAGGVLAWLPPGLRCFGTIREIEFARMLNKPVVVMSEEKIVSLLNHDLRMAATFVDAVDALLEAIGDQREREGGVRGLFLGLTEGPQGEDE